MWIARKINRKCKFKRRAKSISVLAEEIYLRADIRCGSPLCNSCPTQHLPHLPADATHYLVPNADAVLQFWEILELPQVAGVIFLTSVLKKVQETVNQRTWRRLRSIFTDQRRCNILFDDEHCIYTWLAHTEGIYNHLEQAAKWFNDHLDGAVSIVLLSGLTPESSANSRLFQNGLKNVKVLHPDEYFNIYWSHDSPVFDLYTSLSLAMQDTDSKAQFKTPSSVSRGARATYKDHLPVNLLETGIASGFLRVGTFFANKYVPAEALVRPSNKGEASRLEILVPGRAFQNRALHGDIVAVKTLTPGSVELTVEEENNSIISVDDDEDTRRLLTEESRLVGEVVGIIQRLQRDYVACLVEEDETALATPARQERLRCIPMDRRIPLVEITTRQGLRLSNQRFILRIDNWDPDSKFPRGHLVRALGPIGDANAEMSAILIENGITSAPFSSLSLQELPEDTLEKPWTIPKEEYEARRDIRHSHRACSIDPPGSKDVDDVLSVGYLDNGLLEVGVHIADVSYFVKQGSLLDLEARSRGTTVYMVGKSWHMLPSVLSENLCSLLGGKDRLAVSVIWTIDPKDNFKVLKTWFGRTIIRSQHQLFYAQAETIMEGKRLPPSWEIKSNDPALLAELQKDLIVFAAFAQNRRELRRRNGALELASTELRFEINDNREPVQVETKTELPMNWIVAEMMIYANSCVAEKIFRAFPTCALLRKHAPPKLDSFTMLLECCEARGHVLDVSSNKQLADSLDRLHETGDPVLERAFRALVTRAMSEAEYFSTGDDLEPSHYYHYGLALRFYTHFTSPIRRYADILVHRMLIAACQITEGSPGTAPLVSSIELQEIAGHLNDKHRASKRAQKECNELYLLMYLQRQAKAERAVVTGVTSKKIMVFIPKYDLRGIVLLEDKDGGVILPEGDANASNGLSKGLSLVKHRTSIQINELKTGKIIKEYKLMDTVWVRLRADGSRAHGPTLKVDLLDDAHPAVLAAQAEGISEYMSRLDISKTVMKAETTLKKSNATSERMKAIQAMTQIIAADSATDTAPLNGKKKHLTLVDVLQNIMGVKASSVFLDTGFESEAEDHSAFSAALGNSNLADLVVSTANNSEAGAPLIDKENQTQLWLRRRWQINLAQAGSFKAKLTTSTSFEGSARQQARAKKELEARWSADNIQMQFR